MKKVIKQALLLTFPVMLGYLSVGMAFGLLFQSTELPIGWGFLMSLLIYAGAMQFVALGLFQDGVGFLQIAMITFFINMRHMFYGLSFIDKFKQMKAKKPYMIFSLTDETYSLLCATKAEDTEENHLLFFLIAVFNHCYWLLGTAIGILAGALITFDLTGIDFAMTALFVVIFIEQWQSAKSYLPALAGICASVFAIVLFGAEGMILPTMVVILVTLTFLRKRIEQEGRSSKDDGWK